MQSELNSLNPKPHVTRREFVVAALSIGFALAVQPVSAATITTDSEGLATGAASIGRGYDTIPGYFARPASGENFPTVLVVQERIGRDGNFSSRPTVWRSVFFLSLKRSASAPIVCNPIEFRLGYFLPRRR